jgi:uncharacterized GH25 family protein
MNRKSNARAAALSGLVITFGFASANAHEFWVEPSAFSPATGDRLGIRLCVGDGFEGWSLARNAERIEQFVAAGPSGHLPVVGLDGSDPAGVVRFTAPGNYVITYRSNHAVTELPAAAFEAYLREKGLDDIAALRKLRGASGMKVREAYSRHSKALIQVGVGGGGSVDRPMGLPLELVAEPGMLPERVDGVRSFRLLYEGQPLAGALVTATRPGTGDGDLKVSTDADGRASFRLRGAGMWRIATVHMIEAPRNVAAEWESLWASLTFELPPQTSSAADPKPTRNAACRNRIAPTALQAQR